MDSKVITFFKKIEPLIAVAVLLTLIYLAVLLYQDNELKKEISVTCGYEIGEKYECYCEKGFIAQKHLELETIKNNPYNGFMVDVELDK